MPSCRAWGRWSYQPMAFLCLSALACPGVAIVPVRFPFYRALTPRDAGLPDAMTLQVFASGATGVGIIDWDWGSTASLEQHTTTSSTGSNRGLPTETISTVTKTTTISATTQNVLTSSSTHRDGGGSTTRTVTVTVVAATNAMTSDSGFFAPTSMIDHTHFGPEVGTTSPSTVQKSGASLSNTTATMPCFMFPSSPPGTAVMGWDASRRFPTASGVSWASGGVNATNWMSGGWYPVTSTLVTYIWSGPSAAPMESLYVSGARRLEGSGLVGAFGPRQWSVVTWSFTVVAVMTWTFALV